MTSITGLTRGGSAAAGWWRGAFRRRPSAGVDHLPDRLLADIGIDLIARERIRTARLNRGTSALRPIINPTL